MALLLTQAMHKIQLQGFTWTVVRVYLFICDFVVAIATSSEWHHLIGFFMQHRLVYAAGMRKPRGSPLTPGSASLYISPRKFHAALTSAVEIFNIFRTHADSARPRGMPLRPPSFDEILQEAEGMISSELYQSLQVNIAAL